MDQDRADYGDPVPPRSRASQLLIGLLVLMGVAAVAAGGWMALPMFNGSCSKYG